LPLKITRYDDTVINSHKRKNSSILVARGNRAIDAIMSPTIGKNTKAFSFLFSVARRSINPPARKKTVKKAFRGASSGMSQYPRYMSPAVVSAHFILAFKKSRTKSRKVDPIRMMYVFVCAGRRLFAIQNAEATDRAAKSQMGASM